MHSRFIGSILAPVVLAFSLTLLAQTAQRPGTGQSPPDLSGVWSGSNSVGFNPDAGADAVAKDFAAGRIPQFAFSKEEPPMQPWAAERYKANRVGVRPIDRGTESGDQMMYPYCMPLGFPRSYTISAFEIVQAPGKVYMIFEYDHQVRRIFTDGRKHLEGSSPSFMGISHGRWDGDTLIVETGNLLSLDGLSWIDYFGHPYTDALHVVERIRRVDHDTLQIDFTFDDPKAYTKPWTGRKVLRLKPDWDIMEQIVCEDHQREDFLRDMHAGKPAGRP